MDSTSSLQLEWVTHSLSGFLVLSSSAGKTFIGDDDCLGNNSHYCGRVMLLGGVYILIHSIPAIPLEVSTVIAFILEIGNWARDRRSFGHSCASHNVITGIGVQTGQEHSKFICMYTTPPWGSWWGQGAPECYFGYPVIQVQGYICECPLAKIIIWDHCTRPHDGDPFSLGTGWFRAAFQPFGNLLYPWKPRLSLTLMML